MRKSGWSFLLDTVKDDSLGIGLGKEQVWFESMEMMYIATVKK